jgi:hypothetical protein
VICFLLCISVVLAGFKGQRESDTGKNDLTRCVTHREAVFGMVIDSIFDAWYYECPMDLNVD